ncbi:MAG: phosphonatase-like hydrolase [Maribacter sp.]
MHNIQLVVFDMAGTVVNENNIVYKTLQKAINQKGFDLELDFILEHGAGKEKHQAIKDILGQIGCERIESEPIFENFKVLLEDAYKSLKVTSFEGVPSLLDELRSRNTKIALNTGYTTPIAESLLEKMGWIKGQQYDALVTADDVLFGRPNPDMIFEAMELLNVFEPEKVLKAGDSIIDIEEGKNAHCGVTVGVTTGAHTRAQLESAKPTYIVDSLQELIEKLDL